MPITTTGAGKYPAIGVGASYSGPGDIVSGAAAWWGLRGYNAAFATGSNAAIQVVDSGGANATDINILTTGFLDETTLNTWIGTHGTASIKKFYDQSGNAHHLVQNTVANMTTIVQSAIGSHSGALSTAASSNFYNFAWGGAQAQPLTFSFVAKNTSANFAACCLYSGNGGQQIGYNASGTGPFIDCGTQQEIAASGSAFHAIQAIGNGASGNLYIDGSSNVVNAGTGGLNQFNNIMFAQDGGGSASFVGTVMEFGIWAGAAFTVSGGEQADLMNTNQHSANGWNF